MPMNGARVRTLIVAVGLGFAAPALGSACLDYAGEDFGACPTTTTTASSTGPGPGSGSGTGAPALTITCGTITLKPDSGGLESGPGSASP